MNNGARGPARRALVVSVLVSIAAGLLITSAPSSSASCETSTGCRRWNERYDAGNPSTNINQPGFGNDFVSDIVAGGGKVFVTGHTGETTGGENDFVTVAYDGDDGTQLWEATEDESNSSVEADSGNAIALSPNAQVVYATGVTDDAAKSRQMMTVAYNAANGTLLWKKIEGTGQIDVARDIDVAPNGTVVITGENQADVVGTKPFSVVTIAYRPDGSKLWESKFPGSIQRYAFPDAIDVSTDTVFIAGRYTGETAPPGQQQKLDDYLTLAYDLATGAQRWQASYGGVGSDRALDVVVSPDEDEEDVYVTGQTQGNFATISYNADAGTQQWVTTATGANAGNTVRDPEGGGSAIAVSPAGDQVYVTGERLFAAPRKFDITTLAMSAETGAIQATRSEENALGDDFGHDVVAGTQQGRERVFVTGTWAKTDTDTDIAVFGYRRDLAQRWSDLRGGTSRDGDPDASAEDDNTDEVVLALYPDNSLSFLFSTGTSYAPVTNYDYDTAAYDAAPDNEPTPSPTGSSSASASASTSASATTSPSSSPSTSPSASPSRTASTSPSPTPTRSPSPSVSPSRTLSASPAASPTPSPSTTPPTANPQRCQEVAPNSETPRSGGGLVIGGTPGDDQLTGSNENDLICGFGGNDAIRGFGGDDTLRGGNGHDFVTGGAGRDVLAGGGGRDFGSGGSDNDIVAGGGDNDRLLGGKGRDNLFGRSGSDDLRGNDGYDDLRGGSGPDALLGGRGKDFLIGGPGEDKLFGGPGNDRCSDTQGTNRRQSC